MLASFSIDTDGLDTPANPGDARDIAVHERVLELWRQFGVLVLEKPVERQPALSLWITRCPQEIKRLWQDALLRERLMVVEEASWNGTTSGVTDPCLGVLSSFTDLLLAGDKKLEAAYGLNRAESRRTLPPPLSLEVVRFHACDRSLKLAAARMMASAAIRRGTRVDEVWETRFSRFARFGGKTVNIVDRYAVRQLLEADRTQLSGLERFLRLLSSDAKVDKHVTIYSALPAASMAASAVIEAVSERLRPHLSDGRVARVKLRLIRDRVFGSVSHDRFVRFENHVLELGIGLEVLGCEKVIRRSSFSLKSCHDDSSFRDAERELAAEAVDFPGREGKEVVYVRPQSQGV